MAAPLGGPRGSVAGRLGRRWWCRGDPAQGRGEGQEGGVPLPGPLPRPPPWAGARGPGSDWRKAPGARRAASSSGAVQARAPGGGDPLAVPCGRRTARVARTGVDHAGGDHGVGPGPPRAASGRPAGPSHSPARFALKRRRPLYDQPRPGRAPVGRIGAHAAPFKEAPSPPPGVQIPKATCSGAVHAPHPRRCGFGRPRHPVVGGGPSARIAPAVDHRVEGHPEAGAATP